FDELFWNRAADDVVDEFVALARVARHEADLRVAILAAAAGLTDVAPFALRGTRERFLVRDLGTADARLDAELALEPVDDDLEVQLAHACDHDLSGLFVGLDAERRVFRHQLAETDAELFLIGFGLRLDCERDHGLGEMNRLEHDRLLFVADRVAGRDASQTHRSGDVARIHL